MDKGATKEPGTSTPAWDELEEWTRGRIQEWMQQLLVEEVTEFLGRRKYQRRGAEMGRLSERLREAAPADRRRDHPRRRPSLPPSCSWTSTTPFRYSVRLPPACRFH